MNVGERIRLLREKAGFSQNELAGRADVSQTHLRRVELGQAGITVDHLQMICDALNITLKEFFNVESTEDSLSVAFSNLTPKQKQLLAAFIASL
jgi:transcriptional regulator with XRE-family HTH domain